MKVLQLLVTLQRGDAIGENALLTADILRKAGYSVATYAYNLEKGIASAKAEIYSINELSTPCKDDLVLYQLCEGSELHERLRSWDCKKIAVYHNTTPPKFFSWLDLAVADRQKRNLREIASLRQVFDHVIADSNFNKSDLVRMGYDEDKITAIPILINHEDYKQAPDRKTMERWNDGRTNILFVGRIAPNKKQEDVIRSFAWYKKHTDATARLILIGSAFSPEYLNYLKEYIAVLSLEDVVFPGHISFPEILAFYSVADIFLCMSEHEGFCVPLVEAMLFDTPIVAYDSTAIASTLGGSGVLLQKKDPVIVGKAMEKIVGDAGFRDRILEGQRHRLTELLPKKLSEDFLNCIRKVVEQK